MLKVMFNRSYQDLTRRVIGLVSGLCLYFIIPSATAGRIFSQAVWESEPIPGAILSVVGVDVNRDGRLDWVMAFPDKLVVADFAPDGAMQVITTIAANVSEGFHRVHCGDFNGDGEPEILLNGFLNGRAFSRLFVWRGGGLQMVQEFSSTVMPLVMTNGERLYSQALRGRGEWSQRLVEQNWFGAYYQDSKPSLRVAKGIGGNTISLFALTGMGQDLAVLKDDGLIEVMDAQAGQRQWQSGLKYGGAVDAVPLTGRDPLGLKNATNLPLPPRLVFLPKQQTLLVAKNNGFLPSAVGAFPNIKSAQYAVLSWTNGGFQERHLSQRYDGAISDVGSVNFKGDRNAIVLAMWSRAGGVLNSSRPKESFLVVLPGNAILEAENKPQGLSASRQAVKKSR